MDDPWDVKSVRPAGHYISCMKLNGTPLLPPVLSKECRREMQYYKLLAKEVEKRISTLQPYVEEFDNGPPDFCVPKAESTFTDVEHSPGTLDITTKLKSVNNPLEMELPTSDFFEMSSPSRVTTTDTKFVIDFSLSINQTARKVTERTIDVPERDFNCLKEKELLLDVETIGRQRIHPRGKSSKKDELQNDKENTVKPRDQVLQDLELYRNNIHEKDYTTADDAKSIEFDDSESYILTSKVKDSLMPRMDSISNLDSCVSLSSKSFTGSLNNLHTESLKESGNILNLTRQRSYTLLNPSPQLLAHLQEQTLTTGVAMKNISMSESLSSLCTLNGKKRRSWDLESAKVKWSSMAMELKAKNLPNSNITTLKPVKQTPKRPTLSSSPPKTKSASISKNKRVTPSKCAARSEPITKKKPSLDTSLTHDYPSDTTITIATPSQKNQPPVSKTPPSIVPEIENPGQKVRELYDKIKKQQLAQMNSLVEKQRKEQMLLQQVFEEQDAILYKQLKTIVPKGAIEAKEAWGEKMEPERGPVSLSQLMNQKIDHQIQTPNSPVTSPLIESHSYINKCDNALRKSRDISNNLKRITTPNSRTQTPSEKKRSPDRRIISPTRRNQSPTYRNSTPNRVTPKNPRTLSPTCRNTSRRLDYDSADQNEPILTDRTNDTLADINVTFPTDNSDNDSRSSSSRSEEINLTIYSTSLSQKTRSNNYCEDRFRNSVLVRRPNSSRNPSAPPTPKQLAAGAKIVAFAKGFLVRRLMKTERVVATVQTIRDALLCALQLHQDREGILGADVDLHRRLIQQITAACYSLHDTFIASSPAERCALLAADRARRRARQARPPSFSKSSDIMSQSHSGVFPARPRRPSTALMTQSTHEIYSTDKGRPRHAPSPRRRPWR